MAQVQNYFREQVDSQNDNKLPHEAYNTDQKPLDMFANNKSFPLSPTDGIQAAEVSLSNSKPPGNVGNIQSI